jgi:hypothetical protein
MVFSNEPSKQTCRWSKFRPGQIVATPGAAAAIEQAGQSWMDFVFRHLVGDWGDVCPDDAKANDEACRYENEPDKRGRILSSYMTRNNVRLWVISEHDRSVTTLLLPSEY